MIGVPFRRSSSPAVVCLGLSLLFSSPALSQFEVGKTTIAFVDSSRGDRVISTRIRYPADVAGTDVPPAAGEHPVVGWAHGLTVQVNYYEPLWEALVPAGYVMALPRTEGTFGADPLELGRDVAFVISQLQALAQDSTSLFFGAIDPSGSAIGGHSMGGGAATLGASENGWASALVTLAALETNPSAVTAAASVSMPSLVIGGTDDCVTPIATNQRPIYEALASPCRYLVELSDGTHCGFLGEGSACDGFEGACATDSLQRAQQLSQTISLMLPWLDAHVRDDGSALATFQGVLNTDPDLVWEGSCSAVSAPLLVSTPGRLSAFPNPSGLGFRIRWPASHVRDLRVHDVRGRAVRVLEPGNSVFWDGRSDAGISLPGGVYWIRATSLDGTRGTARVVLLR